MKLFEALLEGATTQDLLSLLESENTKRHTYMYDTSARRVNRPSGNTIPWLVLWILARFHPRRIWCGRPLPSVQKFTESFNSCTNRIRWQWYFRDKEKLNLSVIVPQKGNTSQCTHPVSLALESWPSSSRFASSREFAKRYKVASKDLPSSSKTPLVGFGSEFLASSSVAAAANDEGVDTLAIIGHWPMFRS